MACILPVRPSEHCVRSLRNTLQSHRSVRPALGRMLINVDRSSVPVCVPLFDYSGDRKVNKSVECHPQLHPGSAPRHDCVVPRLERPPSASQPAQRQVREAPHVPQGRSRAGPTPTRGAAETHRGPRPPSRTTRVRQGGRALDRPSKPFSSIKLGCCL